MERRAEFADQVMKLLAIFREKTAVANERVKLVHGIPYAAFIAMADLLESELASQTSELRKHAGAMAGEAAMDVSSDMNINVVWTQIVTAFKAEEIPASCFRLAWSNKDHPPGRPKQNMDKWKSCRLYMDVDQTLSALAMYLTKQRSQIALKRNDLRDQFSKEPYWVPGKHRQRFGRGREQTACWCFDVDKHPLGYLMCSDEEYEHYIMNVAAGDPRKGELFSIVHAIEEEERKKQNDDPS
jgi:hypothetical protein